MYLKRQNLIKSFQTDPKLYQHTTASSRRRNQVELDDTAEGGLAQCQELFTVMLCFAHSNIKNNVTI